MNNQISFSIKSITQNEIEMQEINLVQKEKYIPEIGMVCKLHKIKSREIKVAHIEKPKKQKYYIGQYKYRDSRTGAVKYITEKIPEVSGKRRHSNSTILKAIEPVLRNETTITYASYQAKNLLNLVTTAISTIWKWIGMIEIDKNHYLSVENEIIKKFSGHISIDEVYDNGDGIIIITDPVEDTILSTELITGKPESKDIEKELVKLNEKKIVPVSCTKDGSPLYMNTIKKVFGEVLLQTCIFHFIKNSLKAFSKWHKKIREQVKKVNYPRGLKGAGQSLKKKLFKDRNLFLKKRLTAEERAIVKKYMESYPELRVLRAYFLKFRRLFNVISVKESENRFWDFIANPIVKEKLPFLEKQLVKYYKSNELYTYLQFDKSKTKKIRTTNHTERTNRKFRKKQKTHYRIRKTERRQIMLSAMIYFHNFKSCNRINMISFLFFQRLRIFVKKIIKNTLFCIHILFQFFL